MRIGRGVASGWGFRNWKGTRPGRGLWGIKHGWWVVISLVYMISPLDAIPDFIPVLGLMDDLGVFVFMLYNLVQWLKTSSWASDLWSGKRRDTMVYAPSPDAGPRAQPRSEAASMRTYEVQVTDHAGAERWVTVAATSEDEARRSVAAAGNYRSVGRVRSRAASVSKP
ncbi:MAG TPA: YkvA family protein [Phycisphaerales bacterium]|nr:YkvA family protein [Phycisphaerales bacterium]